jgi:threonine efflux protein
MEHWPIFFSLAGLHLLIVLSPGPNMWVVSQTALNYSAFYARHAAWGIVAGTALWALAALLGVSVLIDRLSWLKQALQLSGGAYRIYPGINTWRLAAHQPGGLLPQQVIAPRERFTIGLLTVLTNPKSVLYFTSVFATQLTPATPVWAKSLAVAYVVGNASLWYNLMATLFSTPVAQRLYQRLKIWIDRLAGAGFILFGAWLIWEAL